MLKLSNYFSGLLLLIISGTCYSLPVSEKEITTILQPDSIEIGQHVELTFKIDPLDITGELIIPVFNEVINEKVEIIDYGTLDTIYNQENNIDHLKRTLKVTSWESGFHPIEPFEFIEINGIDSLIIKSQPVLLEVAEYPLEEESELKDIKDIREQPITFREMLPWILLGIGIIGLVFLIVYLLKNRKKKPEKTTLWDQPEIPAHLAALQSLEELKNKQLWQKGMIKEYYVELTEIIRKYLAKRFIVNAMESTTDETLELMEGKTTSENLSPLKDLLSNADLVKFAKFEPDENFHHRSMEYAMSFVQKTKEKESETLSEDMDKNSR